MALRGLVTWTNDVHISSRIRERKQAHYDQYSQIFFMTVKFYSDETKNFIRTKQKKKKSRSARLEVSFGFFFSLLDGWVDQTHSLMVATISKFQLCQLI